MGDRPKLRDDLEVRPIREDEFEAVLEVSSTAFGEELTAEDAAAWAPAFPFDRSLGVYDSSRMVATSAILSLDLTVPGGKTVPMGGVTWISTLPTYRRRGLLRRLLADHVSEMTERGEILSGLGASEGVIYGRFGYGPATSSISFSVEQVHSTFHTDVAPPETGRLALLRPEEAAATIPAIHESLRSRAPGTVTRSPGLWQTYFADPPSERESASRMLHVIHTDDCGKPDGYASYRTKGDWKAATSHNEVKVVELMAADAGCYASLWRYLLDTDLAKTISCARGRVDEPLRWLLADPRRFSLSELHDFLWLRLLDIPGSLEARRYSANGQLVIEVNDSFPTPVAKRYLLNTEPGEPAVPPAIAEESDSESHQQVPVPTAYPFAAECVQTEATPDLVLDSGTLASTYLGGISFATLAAAGRLRELRPGAVRLADAMFMGAISPFCSTEF